MDVNPPTSHQHLQRGYIVECGKVGIYLFTTNRPTNQPTPKIRSGYLWDVEVGEECRCLDSPNRPSGPHGTTYDLRPESIVPRSEPTDPLAPSIGSRAMLKVAETSRETADDFLETRPSAFGSNSRVTSLTGSVWILRGNSTLH